MQNDPVTYLWMLYSWQQDLIDDHKLARQRAIFQGSFANPAMAQNILKYDKPDAEMSDEQMDFVMKTIEELPTDRRALRKKRKIRGKK